MYPSVFVAGPNKHDVLVVSHVPTKREILTPPSLLLLLSFTLFLLHTYISPISNPCSPGIHTVVKIQAFILFPVRLNSIVHHISDLFRLSYTPFYLVLDRKSVRISNRANALTLLHLCPIAEYAIDTSLLPLSRSI